MKQVADPRHGSRCACQGPGAPASPFEAATLAHDFGNLLQVAASALQHIERSFDPVRDARLRRISQAGSFALSRAGLLSRALTDRYAMPEPEAGPILPAEALAAIAPLLMLAAGPLIELGFDIPGDLPPVACEIHAFENAVLNLVTNARNAMPRGGVLLLALARQGQSVLLHAIDDGPGMTAATMASAFAPGFTTRRATGGRGLGLAAVRHFAERSGGWVEIDSAPGSGTTVTIGLPAAAAPRLTE